MLQTRISYYGLYTLEVSVGTKFLLLVPRRAVRSRLWAEPLIRNALFRVKKGRTIHTLEFSTIWRILVESEMNSHANPQEFTEW